LLKNLKPPEGWRERMVEALGELLGEKKLDERIDEIKEVIERMDFRWDHGFIADQDAYLEERIKLQQELEKLSPIPDDDLDVAADLLENFGEHWEETGGDRKEQMRLMQLIVSRVWVRDKDVVAMSLRPNYHIALGLQSNKPTEISVSSEKIMSRRERREWFDGLYSLDVYPPARRSGVSAWRLDHIKCCITTAFYTIEDLRSRGRSYSFAPDKRIHIGSHYPASLVCLSGSDRRRILLVQLPQLLQLATLLLSAKPGAHLRHNLIDCRHHRFLQDRRERVGAVLRPNALHRSIKEEECVFC
jgi:hypothetical protein